MLVLVAVTYFGKPHLPIYDVALSDRQGKTVSWQLTVSAREFVALPSHPAKQASATKGLAVPPPKYVPNMTRQKRQRH